MDILQSLCPDPSLWRVVLISPRQDRIVIHLEPLKREACCPICGTLSRRIHSHYLRQPWDLAWSSWPVQLFVRARRFFCDCPDCPRIIFSEPFPQTLKYYGHRTRRLQKVLLEMAHTGSAEGAARLARTLGYVTCGESLRQLQRQEIISCPEPRVIGLDEFALYRAPQLLYGTIIVDLARQRPVEVLSSDQSELVAAWLSRHPGIEVITRDRDLAYMAAASAAAPGAAQIADRFHLVENSLEALKTFFKSRFWKLAPDPDPGQSSASAASSGGESPSPPPPRQPTPGKLAQWEAVKRKWSAGQNLTSIALDLGMDRKTVRKYLSSEAPPVSPAGPAQYTKITPFLSHLRKRWEEGCHNARQLYPEIQQAGYRGKERTLYYALQAWRQGKGQKRDKPPPPASSPDPPPLSRWLLKSAAKLKAEEKARLEAVLQLNPLLAAGYHLKEQFQKMIRDRDVTGLDVWLQNALISGIKPFQGMVNSIRQDLEAVKNALRFPWSNAQCEGQICRLKLIKRAGYGRAKPDLLRQRVLHRYTPVAPLRC